MITSFRDKHRFLSNFWPAVVGLGTQRFPTVEHAYVAAKVTEGDVRAHIALIPKPGQAKRFGRELILRPDWEAVKLPIMENLLRQKFAYPELRFMLKATSGEYIEEGNSWGDTFWGVCKGEGENHLGKLLMKIREEIR